MKYLTQLFTAYRTALKKSLFIKSLFILPSLRTFDATKIRTTHIKNL